MTVLGVIVALQAVAVHWGPAQSVFHTTDLMAVDWALCVGGASSILWLEECRKALVGLWRPIDTGRA